MEVDDQGIVSDAVFLRSPNYDERPDPGDVSLLVIHSISLPPGQYGGSEVEALFANTLDCDAHPYFACLVGLRVSSHFFIRRNGALLQFVPCQARAWHAGKSQWNGRPNCNDYSLGIELEGTDSSPFDPAQYVALSRLTLSLRQVFPIQDIVGHSDIAPGRKTDPGSQFDWTLYRSLLAA